MGLPPVPLGDRGLVRLGPDESGAGEALVTGGRAGAGQRVVGGLDGVGGERDGGRAALGGGAADDRQGVIQGEGDGAVGGRRRRAHQQVQGAGDGQGGRGAGRGLEGGPGGGGGGGEVGAGGGVLEVELQAGGGAVVQGGGAVADGDVDGEPGAVGAGVLDVVGAGGVGLAADRGAGRGVAGDHVGEGAGNRGRGAGADGHGAGGEAVAAAGRAAAEEAEGHAGGHGGDRADGGRDADGEGDAFLGQSHGRDPLLIRVRCAGGRSVGFRLAGVPEQGAGQEAEGEGGGEQANHDGVVHVGEDVAAAGDVVAEDADDIGGRAGGGIGGGVGVALGDVADLAAVILDGDDAVGDDRGAAGGLAEADDLPDLQVRGLGRGHLVIDDHVARA